MASQAAEAVVHQLGGTQREPSMEEILASIRRIIEDSDTGRPAFDTAIPEAANSSSSTNGRSSTMGADIDTFREELRSRSADAEPASFKAPSVDADNVEPQSAAKIPVVEPVDQPVSRAEPRAASGAELQQPARVERKLQTARVEPLAEPAAHAQDDWKQRLASGLSAPVAEPEQDVVDEPTASAPEAPRPAIISEVAGRQVAAAFGELSEIFAASRRRSFDEVAEEMMRPMLQDWLDNNLPTLVERLVREEIERVARGGAR